MSQTDQPGITRQQHQADTGNRNDIELGHLPDIVLIEDIGSRKNREKQSAIRPEITGMFGDPDILFIFRFE